MMAHKSGFWPDAWGLAWKAAGWGLALWAIDRWVWTPMKGAPEWVQGLSALIFAATIFLAWFITKVGDDFTKKVDGLEAQIVHLRGLIVDRRYS
jgi:hypothetical protein